MTELTRMQEKAVAGLCHIWRSGQTPSAPRMILNTIAREEPYGPATFAFLTDVLAKLGIGGRSTLPYPDETAFEKYLIEGIEAVPARVRAEAATKATRQAAYVADVPADRSFVGDALWGDFGEDLDFYPNEYGESREPHCWRCKRNLMGSTDPKCPKCRWIKCDCGACGCNFPSARGDVFGGLGV